MNTNSRSKRPIAGLLCAAAFVGMAPLALTGCDKEVSTNKSTTTKTRETPEGTKKTTETVEKTVETERKN